MGPSSSTRFRTSRGQLLLMTGRLIDWRPSRMPCVISYSQMGGFLYGMVSLLCSKPTHNLLRDLLSLDHLFLNHPCRMPPNDLPPTLWINSSSLQTSSQPSLGLWPKVRPHLLNLLSPLPLNLFSPRRNFFPKLSPTLHVTYRLRSLRSSKLASRAIFLWPSVRTRLV